MTAFAHLKKRWIKVVQPGVSPFSKSEGGDGPNSRRFEHFADLSSTLCLLSTQLVYVVSCEDESRAASTSTSSARRKGKGPATPEDEEGAAGSNKDDPDEGSTCYLAYHNWEHWSSVRNTNGPHTGPPKVREVSLIHLSRCAFALDARLTWLLSFRSFFLSDPTSLSIPTFLSISNTATTTILHRSITLRNPRPQLSPSQLLLPRNHPLNHLLSRWNRCSLVGRRRRSPSRTSGGVRRGSLACETTRFPQEEGRRLEERFAGVE